MSTKLSWHRDHYLSSGIVHDLITPLLICNSSYLHANLSILFHVWLSTCQPKFRIFFKLSTCHCDHGLDHMVVGFTTTCAIIVPITSKVWSLNSAHGEVYSIQNYVIVCQWLSIGRWLSPGTSVSSINKTDRHDITEILLKGALNTITLTHMPTNSKDLFELYTCQPTLRIFFSFPHST